jgi:hypothetical protein
MSQNVSRIEPLSAPNVFGFIAFTIQYSDPERVDQKY